MEQRRLSQEAISLLSLGQNQSLVTKSENMWEHEDLPSRQAALLYSLQLKATDLEMLQQEAQDISHSAQAGVQRSGDSSREMTLLLEKRQSEVEQQIRTEEQNQLRRVQMIQDQLLQDIMELKKNLSDPDSSLLHPSLPIETQKTGTCCYFKDVTTDVSGLSDKPRLFLEEDLTNVSQTLRQVKVLLSPSEPTTREEEEEAPRVVQASLTPAEPTTREEFLQYATEITLDPNTVNRYLTLSDGDRRVKHAGRPKAYPDHPDRFSYWCQVLSAEGLTGRRYWEVEWTSWVTVAVSYRDIQRKGDLEESRFGRNDRSWAMHCHTKGYTFSFDAERSEVLGPLSSRVGVFLDHDAGVLCFYSVQDQSMTLLHRVQTSFCEPLHVGLWLDGAVHFPELK